MGSTSSASQSTPDPGRMGSWATTHPGVIPCEWLETPGPPRLSPMKVFRGLVPSQAETPKPWGTQDSGSVTPASRHTPEAEKFQNETRVPRAEPSRRPCGTALGCPALLFRSHPGSGPRHHEHGGLQAHWGQLLGSHRLSRPARSAQTPSLESVKSHPGPPESRAP